MRNNSLENKNQAVQLDNVSLKIDKQILLDSLSLHVTQGERIAIVGANGAGKTSLLRCLLGLLQIDSGSIQFQGNPLASLSRLELARMIGYVPQQLADDIPFTVLEFIMMRRYAYGSGVMARDMEGKRIAREVTERIGISHLESRPLATLSGGERQKVSLAAALAQQTAILILDEPTAHLDPSQRESFQRLLGELGQNRKTTLLTVTHDLNWASMDFDRIIGMSMGQILLDASPEKIMTQENLHNIFGMQCLIAPHPESGRPLIVPFHHNSNYRHGEIS